MDDRNRRRRRSQSYQYQDEIDSFIYGYVSKDGAYKGNESEPQSERRQGAQRRPEQAGSPKRRPKGNAPQRRKPDSGQSAARQPRNGSVNVRGMSAPPSKKPVKKAKKVKKPKVKQPPSPRFLKIRRIILSTAAVAAVIVVGVYLSLTVWFKADSFRVQGDIIYSSEEIIEKSGLKKGENIFLADKKAAAAAVENAFPYVEKAKVSISIPDALVITVTQAQPAYQVGVDGEYLYISSVGRILEKNTQLIPDLPIIECSGTGTAQVGDYIEFTDENGRSVLRTVTSELEKLGITDITLIDIKSPTKIRLLYDNRIIILLGSTEEINYKLRTAIAIINNKLDPNNTGAIKGRLDVSMCHKTKKSYFNEKETYSADSVVSPPDGSAPNGQGASEESAPQAAEPQGAQEVTDPPEEESVGDFADSAEE